MNLGNINFTEKLQKTKSMVNAVKGISPDDAETLTQTLNKLNKSKIMEFDAKNLFKAPYVYYMAVGVVVGMYVLPKVLKRR